MGSCFSTKLYTNQACTFHFSTSPSQSTICSGSRKTACYEHSALELERCSGPNPH
ncbi:hypothetical protein M3J09_012468 [Ascochyta lentis]